MEYHEIGERFEFDGVTLEVVECHCGIPCIDCYFRHHRKEDFDCDNSLCRSDERKDKKEGRKNEVIETDGFFSNSFDHN